MGMTVPSKAAWTLFFSVDVRAATDPGPDAPDGGLVWDMTRLRVNHKGKPMLMNGDIFRGLWWRLVAGLASFELLVSRRLLEAGLVSEHHNWHAVSRP
jgi:hypothetical protein